MIILGIDPGTATTGMGVLKIETDGHLQLLHFDWIHTSKEDHASKRLAVIHKSIRATISSFKPDIMAIEKLFFAANAKTAMQVSEASGVIKLAAEFSGLPIFEYTPMQVKKEIAGNGRADKEAVKREVRKILSIRSPNHKKTHFDDVCDALAVAICHGRKSFDKLETKGGEKR